MYFHKLNAIALTNTYGRNIQNLKKY